MVTVDNTNHPIVFRGKSTDTKPRYNYGDIELWNNDSFLEIDTGEVLFYDKDIDDWISPE